MPLSESTGRSEAHERTIDMKVFARDDGLFDVEAHLIDRKPFPFWRIERDEPIPAGEPLHDLWLRVTLDETYTIRGIEAASDITPFPLCKQAEATVSVLVGERIASGWSAKVKGALRGAAGCTHLMEMLITLATPALQGIRGIVRKQKIATEPKDVVAKLDTCFAYSRRRDVVKMYWPEHYRVD